MRLAIRIRLQTALHRLLSGFDGQVLAAHKAIGIREINQSENRLVVMHA